MTREIKFRVWKPECKSLMELEDQYVSEAIYRSKKGEHILMQFTGLLDKNGKEIYEGDIITNDEKELFKVIWNEDDAQFQCDLFGENGFIYDTFPLLDCIGIVIGDIYSHPELLTK